MKGKLLSISKRKGLLNERSEATIIMKNQGKLGLRRVMGWRSKKGGRWNEPYY